MIEVFLFNYWQIIFIIYIIYAILQKSSLKMKQWKKKLNQLNN